jgi:hypothetical protein
MSRKTIKIAATQVDRDSNALSANYIFELLHPGKCFDLSRKFLKSPQSGVKQGALLVSRTQPDLLACYHISRAMGQGIHARWS